MCATPGRVPGSKQPDNHYLIALDDDPALLQTYASDLEMGGLFIPTEAPPPLNREILVDFRFPDSDELSTFPARVVQRVPPEQGGQTLRAGMAVVFDNPEAVLARLRPFLRAPMRTTLPADDHLRPRRGMSGAWIGAGAVVCAISILAGAFGAHGLRGRLDARALELWETAARYLMYGGLGIIATMLASRPAGGRLFTLAAGTLLIGSLIFCGTVAILALGGPRWLGAITPIGGLLMIVSFVLLRDRGVSSEPDALAIASLSCVPGGRVLWRRRRASARSPDPGSTGRLPRHPRQRRGRGIPDRRSVRRGGGRPT